MTLTDTTDASTGYQVAFRYHVPGDAARKNEPLAIDIRYDRTNMEVDDTATATATIVNQTGQMVADGEVLASLYSPELNVTVQNLVDAKRNGSPELWRSAHNRLQLLGISDDQIDEILATGKANTHLKIRSPISGHVIKKYVREGQYVDEGMPLYDVADL